MPDVKACIECLDWASLSQHTVQYLCLLHFVLWFVFCSPDKLAVQRYQIPVYGQPGISTQHAGSVGQGMPIAQPVNQPYR